MSHPPSSGPQQDHASISDTNPAYHTGTGGTRSIRSPWPGSNRGQALRSGFTHSSTAAPGQQRPGSSSESPLRNPLSPTGFGFLQASVHINCQATSRQSSTSSNHSFTSPSASGYYATGSLHSGQRSRAGTSDSPRVASSVESLSSLSQGVGSGVGGSSRLARRSPSLSTASLGSPTLATGAGSSGHLTSLVITQLNILLSTIKDANFDSQVEKLRRLLDDNGMELFETYFRRLLNSSWSAIFPQQQRGPPSAESYKLLEQEVRKVTTDPLQAERIARALDTCDFDLDLGAFADHFRLDPVAKTALAACCRTAANGDVRAIADAMLTNSLHQDFLQTIGYPPQKDDIPPQILANIIERMSQDPPHDWGEQQKESLVYALKMRYQKLNARMPQAVESALFLDSMLSSPDSRLAKAVQQIGPRATSSLDACKDILAGIETRDISYPQIANALLYIVIAQDGNAYDVGIFVEGLRQHKAGPKIDWTDVVQGFDKEHLRITKKQFLGLYNALLPLARRNVNFDIQSLWGGRWTYLGTQLSFVTAFLSSTPDELDVTQIPDFRQAFTLSDYQGAPDSIRAYAERAVKHPLVSRDATEALFVMIFRSQEAYNDAQMLGIPETIINPNMVVFLCAASAVPKPWGALQDQALKQLFYPFLLKQHPNYDFVMHSLWMHDKTWVAQRLVEFYQQDNTLLTLIYQHATEHGWLELLLTIQSNFAVDLAAYAHSQGRCDVAEWAQPLIQQLGPVSFVRALVDFLRVKMEDELIVQKESQVRSTVGLGLNTVHALLILVADLVGDDEVGQLYRQSLQTYPRLFNFGEDEKRDAILEANCKNGHQMPEEADAEMQERYKKMYGGESTPDEIVNELKELKVAEDAAKQDLFVVMLMGLFDEYNCFGEYPNEALATTAVLFGGLVSRNVLSGVAEQAAIFVIFEAVSEYGTEDSMYRFGLQALIHVTSRLKEWPHLAERILATPSLRNTQVITSAEAVLKELQAENVEGLNGDATVNGITNGTLDEEFPVDSPMRPFGAIRPDLPLRPDLYEVPSEELSDKVMFALNNVSMRNLEEKFKDLETLEEKHHQWFAHYLVDELAKMQPNFQSLYMQLLSMFGRKMLWEEVLRETYVSCAKMLNAPSTMERMSERTCLKNLAGWLGALTLARNQPILHRNLSFKDLLIEGHETQRLLIAIPFTCKALWHSKNTKVFRPPNPWLMELLGMLSELYHFFDLKLNLKFEIEVLCKDLQLDIKSIEPLAIIRDRPLLTEANNMLQPYVQDGGPDGFGDMHLIGLSKRAPNERFTPDAVVAALPDLQELLQIPQAAGNMPQNAMRHIFLTAAQRAIYEIIAPVVERSVTIAAISTAELVQKDFSTEADVEKLRSSAYTVVKALSGSLALVTCKEPLRMSIMNNIRILAANNMQEPLPEGQIIMFVNDNIDTVCGLVEDAAENHSVAEVDAQLNQAYDERRRHNELRPNEPFSNQPVSRWAQLIPEPFKQDPHGANASGLNRQQLSLYEEFGRQARITPAAHASGVSQDLARGQLPADVLGDGYLPNLPTPAEAPALPRPTPQQQRMQMQPPYQVNGHMGQDTGARILDLMRELQATAREAPEKHIDELSEASPVRRVFNELTALIESAPQRDQYAVAAGNHCFIPIFGEMEQPLEVEVFVKLLARLCQTSAVAGRNLMLSLGAEEDKLFNAVACSALMAEGLMELQSVDSQAAKALKLRRPIILPFLRELLDEIVLCDNAAALRADFALSYDALCQWLEQEPDNEELRQIVRKLQLTPTQQNGMPSPPQHTKQDQLEYLFEEWVHLQRKEIPERSYLAFMGQLSEQDVLSNPDEMMSFFRACLEMSCAAFERVSGAPYATIDAAYIQVDALAKLIASIVHHHGPIEGQSRVNKAKLLNSILSLIVLVMNNHHNKQRERWNARVYFRLFSSLLSELHTTNRSDNLQELETSKVFADALMVLQPRFFPGFTYPWLALLSHRLLVPAFLGPNGRSNGGWETFTKLTCTLFTNLGELYKTSETSQVVQEFHRAVIRFLLMLHHDFPDSLIENHFQLINSVPEACPQFLNLINSASPRQIDQPDPFTPGLKINRLDAVRQAPVIRADIGKVLADAGIKEPVERVCAGPEMSNDDYQLIADAVAPVEGPVSLPLANALIISIGIQATSASSVFSSAAPPARLIERLLRESGPAARHNLIEGMLNQARYANSHTHYYSTALQHLFTTSTEDLQEQLFRGIVERLLAPRPHPWGIIVTIMEMFKNANTDIFDLPWVKAAPQLKAILGSLAQHPASQNRGVRSPLGGMM